MESVSEQHTVELERRVRRLRELVISLDTGAREERHRIARRLHDDPLQTLSTAVLMIRLLRPQLEDEAASQDLDKVEDLVRRALESARGLSIELRDRFASAGGIGPALQSLVDRETSSLGLDLELDIETEEGPGDEVAGALVAALRQLLLGVAARGGRIVRLRYSRTDDTEAAYVLEVQTPDCGDADGGGAIGDADVGGLLEELRERLQGHGVRVACDDAADGAPIRLTLPA